MKSEEYETKRDQPDLLFLGLKRRKTMMRPSSNASAIINTILVKMKTLKLNSI
jgi:hypothetical protein